MTNYGSSNSRHINGFDDYADFVLHDKFINAFPTSLSAPVHLSVSDLLKMGAN